MEAKKISQICTPHHGFELGSVRNKFNELATQAMQTGLPNGLYHTIVREGVGWFRPQHAGRSSVVQEVLFRSRALSIVEIQSKMVLGYLHYLDVCTVYLR